MNLDLWILTALVLFAALGYRSGAIGQLSVLAGMAAGYLCAKPLAAALAPAVAARGGWPAAPTAAVLGMLLMPVILVSVMLVARRIVAAVVPGGQDSKPDRFAGVVVGAAKGGAVAWLLLSIVLAFEQPLAQARPGVKAALDASAAAAFARAHSLLALAPSSAQDRLQSLQGKDPAALLENTQVKKLLADPELAKKLEAMSAH